MSSNLDINKYETILSDNPNYIPFSLEKNICNIFYKGIEIGKGFLCQIPFKPFCNLLPVLIINNHLFDEDNDIFIDTEILILLNDKHLKIKIDESRKMYSQNEKYNITIIEIKPNDGLDINSFLQIDSNIIQDGLESTYTNNVIKCVHSSFGKDSIKIIRGIIKNININNSKINYFCLNRDILIGSPIIKKDNNKVIGIHIGIDNNTNDNIGIFVKGFIKDFIRKTIENKNTITIIYKRCDYICNYKGSNYQTIDFFNKEFISNNKDLKMIINKREIDICKNENDLVNIEYNKKSQYLKIKLKNINIIENLFCMFFDCTSLYSIPDLGKLNISNISIIRSMFNNCISLKELPDISNWDTSKVTDMSFLFSKCSSLKKLPDISKWNTSCVINMIGIFNECTSLEEIPDISDWNTESVIDMSYLFCGCYLLKTLPDISNWNTENVTDLSKMFSLCESLITLPDISKWNISNVKSIMNIFEYCKTLKYLPDISEWNIEKINNMMQIFNGCSSLIQLPNISNLVTNKVTNILGMFCNCSSLTELPNISNQIGILVMLDY